MSANASAFGRPDSAGRWPAPTWASTVVVVLLAVGSAAWLIDHQIDGLGAWQRFYLPSYVKASVALTDTGTYPVRGGGSETYQNVAMRQWMQGTLFDGATLPGVFVWPLTVGGLVLVLGLLVAVPRDLARAKARRQGDRLRGPVLAAGLAGDGIGWQQGRGTRTALSPRQPWVRIPKEKEASHILIMGDIGTGKSSLIRQTLVQIAARGEMAIIHDPSLEFTRQFYTPSRGDLILNPLDTRCPFWSPGDEFTNKAEALAIATSLFPDQAHEPAFWVKNTRDLFAFLLESRPTAHELSSWLCHPAEIDRRVAGTVHASMLDRDAASMRLGFLSTLSEVGETLALIPAEEETSARWSAHGWAKKRKGWLFLTSTPTTQDRLLPLQSLWLDLLALRLMETPGTAPTWLILDELASLKKLPQLQKALTENRKANAPIVIGLQGRAQLEERYGLLAAETMLSQPYTKIVLKTSEPKAAEWCSKMLGTIESERLHENRSSGAHRSHGYELHREREPLIMDSEIAGLPDMVGMLKVGNHVVPLAWPFLRLPDQALGFAARVVPDPPTRPAPVPVPGATPVRSVGLLRG